MIISIKINIGIIEELILTIWNQMTTTYKNFYSIDLSFYKDLKIDIQLSSNYELRMIAREMIYYLHYSNIIMDMFLSSNDTIESAINNLKIVSIDDYMNGADLI